MTTSRGATTSVVEAAYLGDARIDVREGVAAPPAAGQVRIRVAYVGLCGTDLHIVHGAMDARVSTPLVFGHEMSGTIESLGEGVEGWRSGDRVTVMPLDWDGTCAACLAGHQHICQNLDFIGIDSPGALQTLWNVPASTLVALPLDLALDVAALVEPTAVAVHDVRRGEVARGDRVVVLGGGPIGVLIATVARHAGAEVVIAEPDAHRRAQIDQLGHLTIDPRTTDQAAWVTEWTGGAGADVVFEVSGAASAVAASTGLAKVRGTVVVVAIHAAPREVDLKQVFWRELRLLGARVYERADFEAATRLLATGAVPSELLITEIVPLTGVRAAFDDLEQGRAMKMLVDVAGAGDGVTL
jgi:2-desacetyl-2-hydroxyethyl bacteriochlorophyllide A dehydrogenase